MSCTIKELEEGYLQLKRHLYYERMDLDARHRIVEFENKYEFNVKGRLESIVKWINQDPNIIDGKEINNSIQKLIDEIKINVFVKKIERYEDDNTSNFITDAIHTSGYKMKRENVFISLPIELQIMSTLWLNRIGKKIDSNLSEFCFGNRLLQKKDDDLSFNGRLYKIYHFQYAKWWKLGLSKAKSILREDKQDVVMINFDLKNYYHAICLDVQELRTKVNFIELSKSDQLLHIVLENIIIKYNTELRKAGLDKNINKNKFALPIGFIASPVLANDYLNEFDKDVLENIRPSYYGRYVDDIFVVFKSGTPKDKRAKKADKSNYPQLDLLTGKLGETREAIYRFLKYMGTKFELIAPENNNVENSISDLRFKLNNVEGIELQMEKLFVYELDKNSPSNLIENFIQEQRERSSEFRFESEENDGVSSEFGEILFDQSFDKDDASKARIKQLSQNRFEISVFMSRLIRRSVQLEHSESHNQLGKIVSFYRGANCIENWWLWEKICLALVVNNERDYFVRFIKSAIKSIDKLKYDLKYAIPAEPDIKKRTTDSMRYVLDLCISNAIAGNPLFIEHKAVSEVLSENNLGLKHLEIRAAGFTRNEFSAFPLIGLLEGAINSNVSYYSRDKITQLFSTKSLEIKKYFLSFSPVRVKYWQICHIQWLNLLWSLKTSSGTNINRTYIDSSLKMENVLLPSFDIYYKINYKQNGDPHAIRKKYFFKIGEQKVKTSDGNNSQTKLGTHGVVKKELKVIGSEVSSKLRFGLVNEHVDNKNYISSAKGKPNVVNRLKTGMNILDELQRKNCDLGIQPELSVPHSFIWNYCSYSDRHQMALIAGIEHMRIKDVIFNFVMTILPIKVNDIYNDAIPVIRLKNHYAPAEEVMVKKFRGTVPKPIDYEYHLFNWRGLYFTNYYCYELADMHHRTLFQGEIDVLVAPVWNPDTNYYNGVVETSAREIHCVFSQVNTSNYGDTRWTIPAKTELKNPITVKGGTTKDHPFTISLAEFEAEKMREFQNMDYQGQHDDGSFKPTPPDYPKDKAVKRLNNEPFYITEE